MNKLVLLIVALFALVAYIQAETVMWSFRVKFDKIGIGDAIKMTKYYASTDPAEIEAAIEAASQAYLDWFERCSDVQYTASPMTVQQEGDETIVFFITDVAIPDGCNAKSMVDALNGFYKAVYGFDVLEVKNFKQVPGYVEASCISQGEVVCGDWDTPKPEAEGCVACKNNAIMASIAFAMVAVVGAILF